MPVSLASRIRQSTALEAGQVTVHQLEKKGGDARLCESCFNTRPLADFRRRRRGSEHRVRQCRQCHNEFERYRRAAVRARLSRSRLAKDLAQIRTATSANRVKAICSAMVSSYGGPEGFINEWLACLRRDLQRGGFVAMRHFEATLRLIQYCEQDKPSYSQMTDEQLRDLHDAAIHASR